MTPLATLMFDLDRLAECATEAQRHDTAAAIESAVKAIEGNAHVFAHLYAEAKVINGHGNRKYPWAEMAIREERLVPCPADDMKRRHSIRNSLSSFRTASGRMFISRFESEPVPGVRVLRVK